MALQIDGHFLAASSPKGKESDPRHAHLVEQTKKWVSQTFYGALLKQMRESPFKSAMFEGGRGGEVFGSMLDQRLADHMGRSSGNKLVGSIVRSIEHPRVKANKVGNHYAEHKGESSSSKPDLHKSKTEPSYVPTNIRA